MPPKKKAATVANVNANATTTPSSAQPVAANSSSSTNAVAAAPQRMFIPRSFVQLYRKTPVGVALTESLDEMLAQDKIDEATALQVLAQFDRSMYFALKAKAHTSLIFDGHLEEYRLVDSVWTWVLTDATLRFDGRTVRSPRVKIVAMKAYEQE